MHTHTYRFVAFAFAFAASCATWAASTDERQPAVWKTQELVFKYSGFTSHYTCQGLHGKVAQALATLGARGDMNLSPLACSGATPPGALQIKFSALAPATGDPTGTIEARWKTVSLTGSDQLNRGDCELAEQIQREILPMFTIRNLKARMDCIPHQASAGNIAFTVDVLVPAKDDSSAQP